MRERDGLTVTVIAPAKEGSEDAPSFRAKLVLGTAAVKMPDAPVCRIGPGAATSLGDVTSDTGDAWSAPGGKRVCKCGHYSRRVKFMRLEVSDRLAE